MAGPPPTSGRIKKGEVRNPRGNSQKSRDLAKIRRMTGNDLADLTSLLLTGNLEELQGIYHNPKKSIMSRLTAKLLWDCWHKGDISIYRAILDRVVGKPKESQSIEISGPDAGPLSVKNMSDAEIEAQLKALASRDARRKRQ